MSGNLSVLWGSEVSRASCGTMTDECTRSFGSEVHKDLLFKSLVVGRLLTLVKHIEDVKHIPVVGCDPEHAIVIRLEASF